MRTFLKGLRFGMMLQLAVGPICLLVFNTVGASGFGAASLAVLAVTLVDALYILLAGFGAAALLQKASVRKAVLAGGSAVLILFGLDITGGAFGFSLLTQTGLAQLGFSAAPEGGGIFLKAAFLTASNPLTIVFFGGVLSATAAAENFDSSGLFLFGLGCIAATFFFLHGVAAAGTAAKAFLPDALMLALNAGVGVFIIFFGLRMLCRAFKVPEKENAAAA